MSTTQDITGSDSTDLCQMIRQILSVNQELTEEISSFKTGNQSETQPKHLAPKVNNRSDPVFTCKQSEPKHD